MIDKQHPHFSVVRQCKLLGLHRSGLYYKPVAENDENLAILQVLDEQYLGNPFFGVPRLRAGKRFIVGQEPPSHSQAYISIPTF